jgi:hypothetical protein
MGDLVIRALAGGAIVSAFAALGNVLKPKSFAGLFGAAPSVALATLTLTIRSNGASYAALEARSMMAGGVAFGLYAAVVCRVLARSQWPVPWIATAAIAVWFTAASALWLCIR